MSEDFTEQTHPELLTVISQIEEEMNELGLEHEIELTEENPNCFSCIVHDKKRTNFGFVARNTEGKLIFAAFDPVRFRRDGLEGIPEDDSLCWWAPDSLQMFLAFLDGTVAKIIEGYLTKQIAEAKNDPPI